jgi:RNA polymerase sigma-70 factor, ECF subfamily
LRELEAILGPDAGADDAIADAWARARTAWPALPDDAAGFARHVAGKLARVTDVPRVDALRALHAADVYLALHAASGHAPAVQAFLAGPFTAAKATLVKMRCPPQLVEDVEQQVRALVLAGPPAPKLADYAGRGELRSWIASIAARTARKALHGDRKRADAPGDDELLTGVAVDEDDPELAYLKTAYRDAFAAAVRDALAVLTVRERNLLRQHHLDRVTLDELARLYGTHRATVARWLAAARARIVEEARRLLVERLAIAEDELESVVRLVQSQVQVSLARLLAG